MKKELLKREIEHEFENCETISQFKLKVLGLIDSYDDKPTLVEQFYDGYIVNQHIEDKILDLFEKYEPELFDKPDFDFRINGDPYDTSIEVYFETPIPYPYEPSHEITKSIQNLGFSCVYWNFTKDIIDGYCDEIRGFEPRHTRDTSKWVVSKYGAVDDRFNEEEWLKRHGKLIIKKP